VVVRVVVDLVETDHLEVVVRVVVRVVVNLVKVEVDY
jgi:hypothetical protein